MLTYKDKKKIVTILLGLIIFGVLIYRIDFGPHGRDNLVRLNNEYHTLYKQGRYTEAAKVSKHALKVATNTFGFGPDHSRKVKILNNLAFAYQALGRYDEAELLFKDVLETAEKFHPPQYPEHPEISTSLYNLAKLHEEQEKYSEAASLYNRLLEIQKKSYGPNHPKVINALRAMAKVDKKIKTVVVSDQVKL